MSATPLDQPTTPLPVSIIAPGQQAALAKLAFGVVSGPSRVGWSISRHLAFLPAASLELDLDDPEQRQFGDYELIEEIGQGGMGVVYRANQKSLDREVAIKLLSAGPWASKDFIERFRREAQSAARMQHPNIVAIYEIGQHEELNFFSMRLVRGPSLAQVLRQHHRLPARECARLLRTIAEAVDYAHKLGVLHLDLKPGNVLVDDRGEPQVADFGLARRLDETLASDSEEISGTPSYMAPEQAQLKRHKLTPATDIYGLGAVLYECVTGRPPFLGADAHDTLRLVVETEPQPLRAVQPDAPLDLDAICAKCLSKEPNQRYRDARELAEDLGRFIEGRQVQARPLNAMQRVARWARREPRVAAALGALLLVLAVGVAVSTSQWLRAERHSELAATSAASARQTAWHARREIAWREAIAGNPFEALSGLVENLREAESSGQQDQGARDRAFIGAIVNAGPHLIDVVPIGEPIAGVAIDAAGTMVAAVTESGMVHLVDAATGALRWRSPGWSARFSVDRADAPTPGLVRFSPDGRFLVLDHREPPGNTYRQFRMRLGFAMRLIEVATGQPVEPPASLDYGREMTFRADGRVALIHDPDRFAHRAFSVEDWKPIGPAARVDPGGWMLSDDGATAATLIKLARVEIRDGRTLALRHTIERPQHMVRTWCFSPDGRRLAVAFDKGLVVLADTATGTEVEPSVRPVGSVDAIAFSGDGAWVAAGTGVGEVHVWDAKTGTPVLPSWHDASVEVFGLLLDRASGWMAASLSNDRIALYRLPDPVPKAQMVVPGRTTASAMDVDFHSGLLAVGGIDGGLRLWRMPRDARVAAPGPPNAFDQLWFDGQHAPAVEQATVTVVDVTTRQPVSPPLAHPQPVQFAQVTADGASLVTGAAREIRVWDFRTGRLRFDPVILPSTLVHMGVSPDGGRLLATHGAVVEGRFREMARVWSASDGRTGSEAAFDGPLHAARFSPDGDSILIRRFQEIRVVDVATLLPRGPLMDHGDARDGQTLVAAEFTPGGDGVVAAVLDTRAEEAGNRSTGTILRWDVATGRIVERYQTPFTADALTMRGDGEVLAAQRGDGTTTGAAMLRLADGSTLYTANHGNGFRPSRYLAFDPSGRWLARSSFQGVLVTDAQTDRPLAPLLRLGPSEALEPTRVAWSPHGMGLLAQTRADPMLAYWSLQPPLANSDDLARLAGLLRGEADAYKPGPDASVRAMLRGTDPGPWRQSDRSLRQRSPAMLPRDPNAGPHLIDLTAHYNRPLVGTHLGTGTVYSEFGVVPQGLQRFDGIDYDLRGILQVASRGSGWASSGIPARVDGIPAPERIVAIRVLSRVQNGTGDFDPVAYLGFRYRDGGEAKVGIRNRLDALSMDPADAPPEWPKVATPVWAGRNRSSDAGFIGHDSMVMLFAPRLANPHPERDVESLWLESEESDLQRVSYRVFALTAEVPTDVN